MSSQEKIAPKPTDNSGKMLRAMVGIGTLCALLIVLTYDISLPRIKKLKQEALEGAILKVLPGITESQAFTLEGDSFIPLSGETNGLQTVYAGYDGNGNLKGIAVEASGQGYADIIKILYGYDMENQTVMGFYVLESKETPGLGDKIEKDDTFLANFEKLDVQLNEEQDGLINEVVTVKSGQKENPWEVDGITGATISSRAIGDIINKSGNQILPLLMKNKEVFTKTSGNNGKAE